MSIVQNLFGELGIKMFDILGLTVAILGFFYLLDKLSDSEQKELKGALCVISSVTVAVILSVPVYGLMALERICTPSSALLTLLIITSGMIGLLTGLLFCVCPGEDIRHKDKYWNVFCIVGVVTIVWMFGANRAILEAPGLQPSGDSGIKLLMVTWMISAGIITGAAGEILFIKFASKPSYRGIQQLFWNAKIGFTLLIAEAVSFGLTFVTYLIVGNNLATINFHNFTTFLWIFVDAAIIGYLCGVFMTWWGSYIFRDPIARPPAAPENNQNGPPMRSKSLKIGVYLTVIAYLVQLIDPIQFIFSSIGK